jgi:hypothetical protein
MAVKKQTYINAELEWAEQKLVEWKNYVDSNPFHEMKDRIEWKPTAKGGMMPMVVASIEAQIKCVRDTMKEYLLLLEQVEKMRQAEEHKKKEVKGGADRPSRM